MDSSMIKGHDLIGCSELVMVESENNHTLRSSENHVHFIEKKKTFTSGEGN